MLATEPSDWPKPGRNNYEHQVATISFRLLKFRLPTVAKIPGAQAPEGKGVTNSLTSELAWLLIGRVQ